MRIDQEHAQKIKRMRCPDGLKVCPERMRILTDHLSVWEHGLAIQVLMRAASAKKLTKEQRVILALFGYAGDEAEEVCDEAV